MPNGVDILQLNTVTSTSNADKLYVHQNDTLVQVTKSNFMSEINNNIADEYDSTSTYVQGDYCMYNGQLYVCTTTISTSEEWNSSHWTSTTCADGFNANGIPMSEKGSANGVAELDANGKVPTSQLPSYVDDVLEYSSLSAFPSTGETGKIYIALDTNLTYRWSGTVYVEISPSLALGETSSTAYRGDRGATAYTHSQTTSGNPHNVTKSDVGLGNVENFKAVSTEENQGLTNTEQSNAKDNLGLSTVATSGSYTDLTDTPTVDTALDPTSTNAVQNKAIAHELAGGNTQASGDVITLTDGSNLALTSATSTLAPIQDLHGYSNPWVGGAGVNQWDEEWELGLYNYRGEKVQNDTRIRSKNYIPCTPNTLYFYKFGTSTADTLRVCYYDESYNFIALADTLAWGTTHETPTNARYLTFCITVDMTTYNNDICINISNPTINGTYYPYSNICPISGYNSASYNRHGINVWDEQWINGEVNADGTIYMTSLSICSKNYNSCTPNTTYYCKDITNIAFYDSNETFISRTNVNNGTITTPINATLFKIDRRATSTYNNDICINVSNPTINGNYYPYQGQAVTLTFDNTIYSGVIDWCTGVVTVDKGMTDLGVLSWTLYGTNKFYSDTLTTVAKDTETTSICSNYPRIRYESQLVDKSYTGQANGRLYFYDTSYATASDFKAGVDGVQLLYELRTPTTITLTPTQLKTLAGYNTIYTDVGNISIAYQPNNVIAECKEYTDNAIPTVDTALDDTSLNPIANKPVAEAIADIVGDISDIDNNIEGSKQLTTTGNVITVSDSAATYLEELEVEVEPIQDLHGYSSPWVGGAGKNLLDQDDLIVGFYDTDNWHINSNAKYRSYRLNLKAGTYTFSSSETLSIIRLVTNGTMETVGNPTPYTFTVSADSEIGLSFQRPSNADWGTTPNIQLEQGSQATSYEPYSNICPISGYDSASYNRCGVNFLNGEFESGMIDSTGNNQVNNSFMRSKNYSRVISGQTYILSKNSTPINLNITQYDENKVFIKQSAPQYTAQGIMTMEENTKYVRIHGLSADIDVNGMQLELGTQATTYQPYQGQSVTLTFENTIYSGVIDWCNGVVTVNKAMVDLGSLTWRKSGSTGNQYFYTTVADAKPTPNNVTVTSAICTDYRAVSVQDFANTSYSFSINTTKDLSVKDSRYISLLTNEFKTAMDGVQLCYELATPQTIQLTSQQLQMLKGYNTVTTDANGGMTIKYQPDNVVGEIKAYASRLYDDIIRRLNELSS